jgi:hypothetical protein
MVILSRSYIHPQARRYRDNLIGTLMLQSSSWVAAKFENSPQTAYKITVTNSAGIFDSHFWCSR